MESKFKIIIGSIGLLIFLIFLAPFADPNPDGLESAAGEYAPEGSAFNLGFLTDYGAENSILYQILGNKSLSVIISGLIGILIILSIFFVPFILKHRRNTDRQVQ
ncbi:MAG: PDGLE domain-containing protein [Candidatus Hodarchaeales archaeon]|jgi:hypothetical protein